MCLMLVADQKQKKKDFETGRQFRLSYSFSSSLVSPNWWHTVRTEVP